MERLPKIIKEVESGRYPNCTSLAEKFEVSTKTIQRDMEYLRDRQGLPLEYDRTHHGYHFTSEIGHLDQLSLSVEDVGALFLARQVMEPIRGTRLANALATSFSKLTRKLEGKVDLRWQELEAVYSSQSSGAIEADLELFGTLAEAVIEQRVLQFSYRSKGQARRTRRTVNPHHVTQVNGGWYLVAYDPAKEGFRVYTMSRLIGAKVLPEKFERRADFDPNDFFKDSLGIWNEGGQSQQPVELVVRVSGWLVRLVEDRKWHPSQTVKLLSDDGSLAEVRMKLSHLIEAKNLVLGWGAAAEVIKPKALREVMREEVEKMSELYSD